MKMFILLMMSSFLSITLFAHPGIGLVQDSRGNIYYTDLENVWIICTDGKRQVVVPDVHTHELYIDGKDNLYGEHLWYNGEKLNTWRSYAWCLHTNGKLDTVVSPHEGFLENYSFNRDNKGNQYWSEHWVISKIKRKSPA